MSELLHQVRQGEEVIIQKRGKSIAALVPFSSMGQAQAVDEGLITTAKLRMPAYCDSTLTTAYASTNEVGCTVSGNTQSP